VIDELEGSLLLATWCFRISIRRADTASIHHNLVTTHKCRVLCRNQMVQGAIARKSCVQRTLLEKQALMLTVSGPDQ
jgi:hypothetical protein